MRTNSACNLLREHTFLLAGFNMIIRAAQNCDAKDRTLSLLWRFRLDRAERAFRRTEAVRQAGGGIKDIGADGAR